MSSNNSQSDPKVSAAQMDALNLDDLFLGNDEQGDSLFDDMDIDLEDMDGIIGGEGGVDVISEEFGGGDGMMGMMMMDASEARRKRKQSQKTTDASANDEYTPRSDNASSTIGKKGRTRVLLTHAQIVAQMQLKQGPQAPPVQPPALAPAASTGPNKIKTRRGGSSRASTSHPPLASAAGHHPALPQASTAAASTSSKRRKSSLPYLHDPNHPSTQALQHLTNLQTANPQRYKLIHQAQSTVSNFGMKPSETLFFPYMHLPPEVEVKKGQKAFPWMDKLNHASAPDGGGHSTKEKGETSGDSTTSGISSKRSISTSSPLYAIFTQHLGALVDNHGQEHSPESLQKALAQSTRLAKKYVEKASALASTSTTPSTSAFVDELAKLLSGCIRQSAFLRQNLWNMECYAEKHLNEEDFKSCFPVKRREVERLSGAMWLDTDVPTGATPPFPPPVTSPPKATKIVASDKWALPSPSGTKNAPTHGGLNSTPVISVKVKLKYSEWRDKSGRRLVGRLWAPVAWKTAARKAEMALNRAAAANAAEADKTLPTTFAKALSSGTVNAAVLEEVASETLRLKMLGKKATRDTSPTKELTTEAKKASRKKKQKDGATGANPSSSVSTATSLSKHTISMNPIAAPHDLPHIPSYTPFHPAILAPDSVSSHQTGKDCHRALIYNQHPRVLHSLHAKIFNPFISPSERRTLLANEISSTLQRMENARLNHQLEKAQAIRKEMKALQHVYKEDLEAAPEMCNTAGLWKHLEETKYFDKLDEMEDVYDGLEGCWQPELDQTQLLDDGGLWGSLLPPVKVASRRAGEKGVDTEEQSEVEQSSLLFDRLQSLLVYVDGSDEGDNDDDDDDELLSSLPDFTPEQFTYGPASTTTSDKDAMLDVSALTLDQRTFIQLRAAGLIDTSTSSTNLPVVVEDDSAKPSTIQPSNSGNDESIDNVIQLMKADLSTLHVKTNAQVATLQRTALRHISRASNRKRKERDDEATMSKYKLLQKIQKEQNEKRRVSGRVKTGSNKFDVEQWLPW